MNETNPITRIVNAALDTQKSLVEHAEKIAADGPPKALQKTGIVILSLAILLKSIAIFASATFKLDYSSLDFAIMLTAGMALLLAGAALSFLEYRDKVRWHDRQLRLSHEISRKAFDVGVEGGRPPVQQPTMLPPKL